MSNQPKSKLHLQDIGRVATYLLNNEDRDYFTFDELDSDCSRMRRAIQALVDRRCAKYAQLGIVVDRHRLIKAIADNHEAWVPGREAEDPEMKPENCELKEPERELDVYVKMPPKSVRPSVIVSAKRYKQIRDDAARYLFLKERATTLPDDRGGMLWFSEHVLSDADTFDEAIDNAIKASKS